MSRVHGGRIHAAARKLGINPSEIIDLSASLNPFGPPDWLTGTVNLNLTDTAHYPDSGYYDLIMALAGKWNCDSTMFCPGNGTSELIPALFRAEKIQQVFLPVPTYSEYQHWAETLSIPVLHYSLLQSVPVEDRGNDSPEHLFQLDITGFAEFLREHNACAISPGGRGRRYNDAVVICNPNNPTGSIIDTDDLESLVREFPEVLFIVDEAYLDFTDAQSLIPRTLANCIVLRSFTKFYSVPGFRIGYLHSQPNIVSDVAALLPSWNIGSLDAAVALKALSDREYPQESRKYVKNQKQGIINALSEFPELSVLQSVTNFFLLHVKKGDPEELITFLGENKILVRDNSGFIMLPRNYIRISVRTEREQEIFLSALHHYYRTAVRSVKHKTPALMIQGTGSNAGKSLLAAGLCRCLSRKGYRVAPFKAQNMGLNSAVTAQGEEIGRAQYLQAQAAGIFPDSRMNPVLLKPNSDTGSQVILRGKPVGNLFARDYFERKRELWQQIKESYDSLSAEFDLMILEGAGSPAEVNLKKNDIVNMRMALYAEAKVLLVGDIDRGGVFASFIGHFNLFTARERDLLAGYVVNKFRGDPSLLEDAHQYMVEHTGKPVVAVIPYRTGLKLPDEDSVSFKEKKNEQSGYSGNVIILGILDLPHISNTTDLDPFFVHPDVITSKIQTPEQLDLSIDCILIPGSKNVIGDIQYMQERGFDKALRKYAKTGVVFGICGGYQILGIEVVDLPGIESGEKSVSALGLLSVRTRIEEVKNLKQVEGTDLNFQSRVSGYEIHHGITDPVDLNALSPAVVDGKEVIGYSASDYRIIGTYLHGVFENNDYRNRFLNFLRERKGIVCREPVLFDPEKELDDFADFLEEHLDISAIERIIFQ